VRLIAELSCNHQGTLARARELVHAAALAGASGIKLQTWTPGTMTAAPHVLLKGPWAGRELSELYAEAHTPWEWHEPLFQAAREHGLEAFSSVFDLQALAFLEGIGCPRYKIASFELVDLPLIDAVARTGKPLVLSTGMASSAEIQQAVDVATSAGLGDITLLKCTSAYPADGSQANLAAMVQMGYRHSCVHGLSDHTPGIGVAIVAASLGAVMIEKHFTLSRAAGGLDAEFSIEPEELAVLAREIKHVEKCMGKPQYGPTEDEKPQLELRRSLYFARDVPAGAEIREKDLRTARPALGISPRFFRRVQGMKLLRAVQQGEPVTWDALERKLIA
jgi:N-acetylneuraminate synthase